MDVPDRITLADLSFEFLTISLGNGRVCQHVSDFLCSALGRSARGSGESTSPADHHSDIVDASIVCLGRLGHDKSRHADVAGGTEFRARSN